ncbi:Putative esterase [Nosema bombycis CQ1]|uniref:Putative esterase n=1 Tax=Nosema bombycis (strain CQ1 / CVCC 102059) TaxID=578461 RepID=R0MP86_NOSB1|nr:Putative esterase [Nosema bombycis CQ1]|eukprot:EOB14688.1 Putative esterase [Nosema bombycis CQ1]
MFQMVIPKLSMFLLLNNKITLVLFYLIYYFVRCPSKPELYFCPTKKKRVDRMESLHKKHMPLFLLHFGLIQSLLQLFRPVNTIIRKRITISAPHDGQIIIDMTTNSSKKNVLLVHGFNGSSNSKYIRALAYILDKEGYQVFCFNARGTTTLLDSEVFFHIGWTVDLKVAVDYILDKYKGTLELYGFSMGAAWVTKFLGESIVNKRIIKGGAICLPFDFSKIEKHFNNSYKLRFYNRLLAHNFFRYINRNWKTFSKTGLDLKEIAKCRTIRDIDNIITKKVFAFEDISKYYKDESCVHHIKNIKIPFLILNSKDDPVIPEFTIDIEECRANKNILLVVNKWGGHLGFLKNSFSNSLADDIILDFSKYFK